MVYDLQLSRDDYYGDTRASRRSPYGLWYRLLLRISSGSYRNCHGVYRLSKVGTTTINFVSERADGG